MMAARFPPSSMQNSSTLPTLQPIEISPTLVRLAAGGAKPPIFFVHGAGGTFKTFAKLAQRLGGDHPVYAFQSRGLKGETRPLLSVEAMARDYVTQLRSVRPHGPYCLGGFSLGALIAYEMARQLQQIGEPVDWLINLDMPAPAWYIRLFYSLVHRWAQWRRWSIIREVMTFDHVYSVVNIYLTLNGRQRLRQLAHDVKNRLRQRLRSPINIDLLTAVAGDVNALIYRLDSLASHRYMPRPYAGRMLIFRATSSRPQFPYVRDIHLRWGKLARGGVETILVAGSHEDLIRLPQVEVVAEQLRLRLE